MPSSRAKIAAFVVVTIVCVGIAVVYTTYAARRSAPSPVLSRAPQPRETVREQPAPPPPPNRSTSSTDVPRSSPTTPVREPAAAAAPPPRPYVVAINVRDSPQLGTVEFFPVDAAGERTTTSLRCERVHFANTIGICLTRRIRFMEATTIATVVDRGFQEMFSVSIGGIPSRAR